MAKKVNGIVLDFETADRITIDNLKESLAVIKKEIKDHLENGAYLHPEDLVEYQTVLIPSIKTLIKYYGG